MPGIRVWRPDGVLSFDGSHSLLRYIGTATTNGATSGSINIPQWAAERPWFFTMFEEFTFRPNGMVPTFSIAGAALLWSPSSYPPGTGRNIRIYYGVY